MRNVQGLALAAVLGLAAAMPISAFAHGYYDRDRHYYGQAQHYYEYRYPVRMERYRYEMYDEYGYDDNEFYDWTYDPDYSYDRTYPSYSRSSYDPYGQPRGWYGCAGYEHYCY